MPRVPVYNTPQQNELRPLSLPRANAGYAASPLEYVGAGATEASRTFANIQEAADIAEGGRLLRETSADLQATVKQAAIEFADPKDFEENVNERIQNVMKLRQEAATNPRVRMHLQNHIGDDLILRKQDVQTIKQQKMRTVAEGNWIITKNDALQAYSEAENNPAERTRIVTNLGTELRDLAASNLMDANDKEKELRAITSQLTEIDIRRDFKNDPIGTLERIDAGHYTRKGVTPDKLDQIKDHLATSYRVAQNAIRQKVKDEQDENFADAMVRARRPGGLTQKEIDDMSLIDGNGKRRIDAAQADHLTKQLRATEASGGVLYSNQATLTSLQYRLHNGRGISFDEIRTEQQNGNLTIGDANELYGGLEAKKRRDRSEAREIVADRRAQEADDRRKLADERLRDISNDLNYKRAKEYIEKALPNADRLDLDHSFRIMVGQAFVDFDTAARATDPDGKPKYRPADLQKLAENVVEGTLYKMNLKENAARAKLLPGIKTPEDIANAVRQGRLLPIEAKRQMEYLLELGVRGTPTTDTASPIQSQAPKPTQSRDEAARERAKAAGAK